MPGMIIPPNENTTPSQKNMVGNITFKQQSTELLTKRDKVEEHANKLLSTLAINSNQQQPPTTGEVLANGLQLSVAPVRRYKQYTEETLQQALREIMEGQR